MKTGLIYTIICKVNHKRYVGQTIKNVAERWKEHIAESKRQSHRPLYRSIQKYGVGMFNIRILEEDIPLEMLDVREKHWIEQFDSFNNGFNLTSGGESNKFISEDTKKKISSTMTHVSHTDTHSENISKALKGKKSGFLSDDYKSEGGIHLRRQIKAIKLDGGKEFVFDSSVDCANKLGCTTGNISRALKTNGTAKGYRFERIDPRPVKLGVVGKCIYTGEIKWQFDSIRSAGRVLTNGKYQGDGIRKSIKNPGKVSYKKCYWYHQHHS